MKHFLKYSDFLNEGLATARKTYVSNGKINEEDFLLLSSLDPTKTKKHLDKMCEFFFNGISIDEIKTYIDKFEKLSSNLDNKDINSYDFDTLKSTIDNYSSKSQIDNQSKKDIDVVFEDERYLVVRPTTQDQAAKYGRDTKWCISGYDGEDGKAHWNKYYTKDMLTFYFIIDKTLDNRDSLSKVSIGIDRYGNTSKVDNTTVNSKNKNIDGIRYIKKCGLDISLFKKREITKLKMWGIDLSELKDGIYKGNIDAPRDITEFRGFKEELGLEINEIYGHLSFYGCKNLTNVGVLPDIVDSWLSFYDCVRLENINKLPSIINDYLSFDDCKNLTYVGILPETIKGRLYLKNINQKTKDLLLSQFKLNYWGIDLSKLKDGVYNGDIYLPKDITEFKGFKEELSIEINEVKGRLDFHGCKNLTNVGVLPTIINSWLDFHGCSSLTNIDKLPNIINDYLSFEDCKSLAYITTFPKVVSSRIFLYDCPFFENMDEEQIREKYNIAYE